MVKPELTSVHRANEEGTYRTSIPAKIARELELEYGDKVAWYLEEKSGKKYAIVKRAHFE